MSSRRQRYFRIRSPTNDTGVANGGTEIMTQSTENMSTPNMVNKDGLEGQQQELDNVEAAEDDSREDEAHHVEQYSHDEASQARFAVPPIPPRRPGRPSKYSSARATSSQPSVDMVSKLQQKGVHYRLQHQSLASTSSVGPPSRISPGGARIVSIAPQNRKRQLMKLGYENTIRMGDGQIQQAKENHQPSSSSAVKVVRLVPGSLRRTSPHATEQALAELDARIKDVCEEAPKTVDVDNLRRSAHQAIMEDDITMGTSNHSSTLIGVLLGELERAIASNQALTEYYRQRQRHERQLYEFREDTWMARHRQLETENRKLRGNMLAAYHSQHAAILTANEQPAQQQSMDREVKDLVDEGEHWIVEPTPEAGDTGAHGEHHVDDDVEGMRHDDVIEREEVIGDTAFIQHQITHNQHHQQN